MSDILVERGFDAVKRRYLLLLHFDAITTAERQVCKLGIERSSVKIRVHCIAWEPDRLSILLILLPHYFVNHVESVLVACTAATLPAAPVSMFCIRCAPSTAPGTDSMSSLSFLTSL
jgi:hypothetical protein